jgi:hypothetical protein
MRRSLLIIIAVLVGIGLGLFVGWYVWPVTYTEATPQRLRQDWKDEAIWMAAQAYVFDHDLETAQTRLRPLGFDDLGRSVLDRAERALDRNWPPIQITYLARLAAALGARSTRLDPYLTP